MAPKSQPMVVRFRDKPPKLDFCSWILGGDLVTRPVRSRALVLRPSASSKTKTSSNSGTVPTVINKASERKKEETKETVNETAPAENIAAPTAVSKTTSEAREDKTGAESKPEEPKAKANAVEETAEAVAKDRPEEPKAKADDTKITPETANKTIAAEKINTSGQVDSGSKPAGESIQKRDMSISQDDLVISRPPPGFSRQDDIVIIAMRDHGNSWSEIVNLIGGSKHEIKVRYSELTEPDSDIETMLPRPIKHSKRTKLKLAAMAQADAKQTQSTTAAPPSLKGDAFWTQEDCDILEMLIARYKETEWLQVQAGFYNITGRMISAEMIEGKFRKG